MKIRELILNELTAKGVVRSRDIVAASGLSRAYVNRFFQSLVREGVLVQLGKARAARYVAPGRLRHWTNNTLSTRFTLINKNLSEDSILDDLKFKTGVFLGLRRNVAGIVDYAFTEMLNNAIEHSQSDTIQVSVRRTRDMVTFEIRDHGIGIFRKIARERHLKGEWEAIQDLLKGKQTTAPDFHSGEGIFFTSRVGQTLVIHSSTKKLTFNNVIHDVFVAPMKELQGTKVIFTVSLWSRTQLEAVFRQYTGSSYEFAKTEVAVRLYAAGTSYVSRSQARRIVAGLDKFTAIILDFKNVAAVGQAFADEIFRVFQANHPQITIRAINANEAVSFMLKRAERGAKDWPVAA